MSKRRKTDLRHTPGPWVAVDACEGAPLPAGVLCAVQTRAEPWKSVGRICGMYAQGENGRYSPERSSANALLVAAAPDLLAACAEVDRQSLVIEGAVRDATGARSRNHDEVLTMIRTVRAALAKAMST